VMMISLYGNLWPLLEERPFHELKAFGEFIKFFIFLTFLLFDIHFLSSTVLQYLLLKSAVSLPRRWFNRTPLFISAWY
jgi:hypothetical protein